MRYFSRWDILVDEILCTPKYKKTHTYKCIFELLYLLVQANIVVVVVVSAVVF